MTAKEFVEKMAQDEALRTKMEACKTPEEAYAAAKEAGVTDEYDTFVGTMTELYKQVKGELSDAELENISGGMSTLEGVAVGAAATGTISLGIATAALAA